MNCDSTKIWNATLYLRLSREAGDREESNSIAGQRDLLREYLKHHPDIREYTVRADDGWSGSNFERPEFKQMMDDVKTGKTDCIIVKDLSRFGRNFLGTGEYIEKVFPFLGVRFIAVAENYDSMAEKNSTDDIIIPFRNLINEAYCRDISMKTRSQFDAKRRNGQFIQPFTVYGYQKDPCNKNRIIIDEYAADIVRDIFRWKLDGISPQDIADRLNGQGISAPADYKREQGLNYRAHFKANPKSRWSVVGILRILKNPIYVGTLIQGKQTTVSYNVRKRINKPEEEWAVVHDNHEAIISKPDFETVQRVLAMDTRRSPNDEKVSLFSGLVYCGECGANMVRMNTSSTNKRCFSYRCSAHKKYNNCSRHTIMDSEIEEIVLTSLQEYIKQVIDLDSLMKKVDTVKLHAAGVQTIQHRIDAKRSERERVNRLILSLYESLTDGIITQDEYDHLKQKYYAEIKSIEQHIDTLRKSIENISGNCSESEWIDEFRKHRNITKLERRIVVSLIDRIVVYKDKRIEIVYRCQDEFERQSEVLEQVEVV